MIHGATLMGLTAGEVAIQGPNGPLTIAPEPAAPLAVFRIDGWEPGAAEDEAQGHKLLVLMEGLGTALADDKITPEDIAALAVPLNLPGGRVIEMLVPISQEIIRAVQDDGKLSASEILSAVKSALLQGLSR